ncbi:conserved hypothetical protein [Vibrio chagasii]|nr:conserved hypothetical protein [Vibrio chagasii]CAH6798610.1 conserved hypothetical protein [Vibrio chagasii]CAH6933555.1 conserved hypothetical protein [Vibrio chagasii]CAH6956813.1 conserved hypothetical protein [Vibrio chagasii]CAH6967954.1 conserved hypothetical protein [Vibrio chagasii]
MSVSEKILHCGNCNKETPHIRLSSAEIEAKQLDKNTLKSHVLNIVFGVLLGTQKSKSQLSYFKCSVCHAEYDNDENVPNGWS